MIRLLVALVLLASVAHAETARVASGEHDDFTRLVVQLPAAADWTVGRVPLGYGFAASMGAQPTYDLSSVWDRIPRTRLQSLRVDPDNGALILALACDCHVFPFEYRPGMIVLDIKNGPPPPGSSFEAAFAPVPETPVDAPSADGQGLPSATVTPGQYDWLADKRSGNATMPDLPFRPAPSLALATGSLSLDPLRDELLAQISRGASDGIVDMELPGKPVEYPATEWGELPWTTIRLGEAAGVEVRPGGGDDVVASGVTCLPDTALDVAAWNEGIAETDLLSHARTGLFGEFDRPDADAVLRAVRMHLYLGFGAEARGYADLLSGAEAEEIPFYRSMSLLVDGGEDPQTPFAQMLPCDGAAALWAALAHDRLPLGPEVNTDAILRAFLGLPPHLRRSLGSALAEKLLARDDVDAARMIRDTINRTPEADPAAVALLDAKAGLHAGDAAGALAHAEEAVASAGDDVESLITLVEAHFGARTPLPAEIAVTLQTLVREAAAGPEAMPLRRAYALALAMSGDTDAAFLAAEGQEAAMADLWQIVPTLSTDDAFLTHAVPAETAILPELRADTASEIATRLVALGFPDAALRWLGPVAPSDVPNLRRLAAEAEVQRGNARAAADLLEGLEEPEAVALRGRALVQLGAYTPGREALVAAGAADEADRILAWEQDWTALGTEGAEPWASAARLVERPALPADAGPLGQGASLLDDSAAMREAVTALLAQVSVPED